MMENVWFSIFLREHNWSLLICQLILIISLFYLIISCIASILLETNKGGRVHIGGKGGYILRTEVLFNKCTEIHGWIITPVEPPPPPPNVLILAPPLITPPPSHSCWAPSMLLSSPDEMYLLGLTQVELFPPSLSPKNKCAKTTTHVPTTDSAVTNLISVDYLRTDEFSLYLLHARRRGASRRRERPQIWNLTRVVRSIIIIIPWLLLVLDPRLHDVQTRVIFHIIEGSPE